MQLTLIKSNVVIPFVLPEKVSGQYWVTHTNYEGIEERLLRIEAIDNQWVVNSYKGATLINQGQKVKEKSLTSEMFHHLIIKESNDRALLYVEPLTVDRCQYEKLLLPNKGTILIGRNENCDIMFSNTYVSGEHVELTINQDSVMLQDLKSSNGTYVNGIRVTSKRLEVGDTIYVMGLKIIFGDGFLALNNPDKKVVCNRSLLKKFTRPAIEEVDEEEYEDDEDFTEYFYRSPRFKKEIEEVEITIDGPPNKDNQQPMPLALVIGPSLTMGMASLFTAMFTVSNVMRNNGDIRSALPTIVMSGSMILGTVMWPLLSKSYEKKRRIKKESHRQEKYLAYLKEMDEEFEKLCYEQSEIIHLNNLEISECVRRIQQTDRMLWERAIGQDDFLKVRIGIGDLPLKAEVKAPQKKFTMDDDLLQDEMFKIIERPKILKNVPITLSLLEQKVAGVIGSPQLTSTFIKNIIIQLIALHSYDELKLIFLYNSKDQEIWNFVKWLPHVLDESTNMRFIATDQSDVKAIGSILEAAFEQRQSLSDQNLLDISPRYVVISLDNMLSNKSDLVQKILKEKRYLGFSLLVTGEGLKDLPKECNQIIELENVSAKLYDKQNITNGYLSIRPELSNDYNLEDLAIKLANTKLDQQDASFNLPTMITFLELFGVGKVEHLNSLSRWKENDPTISLDTPIGIDTMGSTFHLDLHEKYHGPHGLVAGMTGSGKSEFIISYILSLAVNYHPNEVAFILIDYKGGGMANAFANLPHLVGTITNLDGAAVQRSLLSIQSELKRRQAIFSQTSKDLTISNIDIYRYQKLFREGKVEEPLPHLFIISDEFAELKSQEPEFMAQLVSAARIGRSLGIHLILATQKPSGVVDDQIWTNSKFKVCLKVQDRQDSNEMIKRPDAADLTNTGRFYLQVGNNELFELGQSSWSGIQYFPTDKVEKNYDNSITVINKIGRPLKQVKPKAKNVVSTNLKQVDAVLNYLCDLSKDEDIRIKPLWLEPIPAMIYLKELMNKYHDELNFDTLTAIVGEYDDPTNQAQHLLTIPVQGEGNIVVYGGEGSGKTTFLTTLMYSLIQQYSPKDIHMYALDFSLGTLKPFEKAPHIGDVILSDELEKVKNLFKLLTEEIDYRKQLLSEFGGDYGSYIKEKNNVMPLKLVIIHNYSVFKETDDSYDEMISYLTREGTKYGVYFIVTCTHTQALSFRTRQNFKQTYVLQMNDPLDYSSLLGGGMNGMLPASHKGRGLLKKDMAYEFQIAHIGSEFSKSLDEIKLICKQKVQQYDSYYAPKTPVLPKILTTEELLNYSINGGIISGTRIGLEKETLKVNGYDFTRDYINIVSSEEEEYGSFIQGLAEIISQNDELILFDPKSKCVSDFEKKYKVITDSSSIKGFDELLSRMLERHHAIKDARINNLTLPTYNKIFVIINSLQDLFEMMDEETIDKLKNVLENGQKEFNVNFIIYDTVGNLQKVNNDDWYKSRVDVSNGIWLGDGISHQKILKYDIFANSNLVDIGKTFGYNMSRGKLKLIKLVNSNKVKHEDVYHG